MTNQDYISVPVATIVPTKMMGVSLYLPDAAGKAMLLYRGPVYPFQRPDIQRLVDRGVPNLYVAADEHHLFQQHVRKNLAAMLEDESIPARDRFATLNEVVRDVMKESFGARNVEQAVENSQQFGQHLVHTICDAGLVNDDLLKVLHHDYQTFTHCTNVGYYCVMLAKELGISDKDELQQIATGALLHDYGKLEIMESILNKPSRLDEVEYEEIQRHPTIGFRRLCLRDDISFGQLMMVYQHHERMDGAGYPVGVTKDAIHPWAKICAVADVFEALTSRRPYRTGLPANEALSHMEKQPGAHHDESVLECWKTIITSKN